MGAVRRGIEARAAMTPSVTVSLVNYNHARYLPACLDGLRRQSQPPDRVVIVDNKSTDGSVQLLAGLPPDVEVVLNERNRGYAGGHNQVFGTLATDYVLALNCDVVLHEDFLASLAGALESLPGVGSACGVLFRGTEGATELDSTGLFPDRYRRFQDRREAGKSLVGTAGPAEIFGPSGSAAFYRTAMLRDVAIDGRYFDETFFAYCEDADLAWRARRRGWSSVIVPTATGWHVHDDLSRARSANQSQDATSRQLLLIRNRHLCLIKNESVGELLGAAPRLLAYIVGLQTYLLFTKPRLALRWPLAAMKALPHALRQRRRIFATARNQAPIGEWMDWTRERPAASPASGHG